MNIFQDWPKLLHTLQTRPQKILRRNIGLDRLVQQAATEQQLRQIIDRYTPAHPIFLLLECFGRSCPLNRLCYPARRNKLIKKLYAGHIPHSNPLTFISYGSGALLQDVIFLAHLIPLAQPSHIDIQLIDPLFELCDQTHAREARLAHITQVERHLQFERWLKNTFPKTTSDISYHTDIRQYCSRAQYHGQNTTICVAVDMETQSEALQDFMKTADICFVIAADNPGLVVQQRK